MFLPSSLRRFLLPSCVLKAKSNFKNIIYSLQLILVPKNSDSMFFVKRSSTNMAVNSALVRPKILVKIKARNDWSAIIQYIQNVVSLNNAINFRQTRFEQAKSYNPNLTVMS